MHKFLWLAALLPSVCLADQFAFLAPVTDVTLHPSGATVERQVPFSIPAGRHELILRGIYPETLLEQMRFRVDGATLETVNTVNGALPPRDIEETAAAIAARAEVERLEDAFDAMKRDRDSETMRAEAARAQIAFLEQLHNTKGIAADGTTGLRELSQMIAQEVLAARREIQAAETAAAEYTRPLEDLERDLAAARRARDALIPDADKMAEYILTVSADAATEGLATISYYTNKARWYPSYEAHLTRGDAPKLQLKRAAWVAQSTQEGWKDVVLHLTTVDTGADTQPNSLYPDRRVIEKPRPKDMAALSEPVVEAPVVIETAAQALEGISVTYDYPQPVTISPQMEYLRIPLSEVTLDADVFARAVTSGSSWYNADRTGFAMASFTNSTQEILLPSEEVQLFIDGHFNGVGVLPMLAGGEEGELSFGPIAGLQLEERTRDRSQGDRGILSKSNQLTEAREIEIRNLTGTAWPVRLRTSVPYSEQEDLQIDWTAQPQPSMTDADGLRGILEWRFDLGPGTTKTVRIDQNLSWPEDYELR